MKTIISNDKEKREMVKDWLNEYRFHEDHVATLTERMKKTLAIIQKEEECMEKDLPSAYSYKEYSDALHTMIPLEELLEKATMELGCKCNAVIRAIESIPSPEVRKVISDHYYKNMTLKAIAYDMDISLSKTKYLHRTGLDWLAMERLRETEE